MRIFTRATLIVFSLLIAGAAQATNNQPTGRAMEPIIGTWISPDGAARQQVEPSFDGAWLLTRQ